MTNEELADTTLNSLLYQGEWELLEKLTAEHKVCKLRCAEIEAEVKVIMEGK